MQEENRKDKFLFDVKAFRSHRQIPIYRAKKEVDSLESPSVVFLYHIRTPFCPKTVRSFQTAQVRGSLWLYEYSRYSSPAVCRWGYGGQG